MSIKFTTNEIRYIGLFETITSATVKDCIIDEEHDKVTFLVKKGDMGLAIGKRGSTIAKMQNKVDKSIEIIEHSDDPGEFIKNLLSVAKVNSIEFSTNAKGNKIATLDVDSKTKRSTIGKNGQNIRRARQFAKRQFDISDIIIK
ncbi:MULTISPECIES: NusA-like transcription termination signal-binding factor [Methanosphaera]|jgi:N utilization substance protein A|uniref:Probable transcription termination protein NusA n=2 Tax=Methanosphaera stadtmanae TaxID=2317 RepID=Q2NEK7_METST|nr:MULTISPECIES: NusA-like transcription termination signal-binding factor [Methanosphaera]ABC57746.1 NusA [Methanosphaera stadtmanae DSM 3091]MDO5822145.1 NusA-like transcription termination signal-binding factor [Methanosphaera sp.]MEE0489860.1 NusA-like transcription termination signal-binding factor [Methanosphaera stadtmanae]OEC85715.1 transcription elongation factor NusA [Methanosphaera sp. A6]RAP02576.1 transcription elongation factor NusA [Methanosphaera stadtmanae]